VTPQRDPYLQVTWTDEETGRRGYLVIDRLGRGLASGGLRMRDGVTLQEVGDLARGMTLKEAVAYRPGGRYLPVGGGKGGIDCSPHDPAAYGLLVRYLRAMKPYLQQHWATGEDLGLRQEDLDRAVAEVGLRSSIDAVLPLLDDVEEALARLARGFGVRDDGVGLDALVGGFGVAEAVLATLDHQGRTPVGVRAVVQGFGSIGGATARFLSRAGVRVVAVADADGVVANERGLDVEALLARRDAFGRIDRGALGAGDVMLPGTAWLDVDAEVLVPAAVSYAVDLHDVHRVRADLIVEGANVPVTGPAEVALRDRGVVVIPDFVANSGTNSWWWWTLFGDVAPERDAAYDLVRASVRGMVSELLVRAEADGVSPRAAATAIAQRNLELIGQRAMAEPAR
jgi:glutamate dehydrogenase (NAD(P)+)